MEFIYSAAAAARQRRQLTIIGKKKTYNHIYQLPQERDDFSCDINLPLFLLAIFDGSVVGIPCTPKQNKVTNNTSFTVNFMLLTLIKQILNQKILFLNDGLFSLFKLYFFHVCFLFFIFLFFCCWTISTAFFSLQVIYCCTVHSKKKMQNSQL